MANTKEVTRLLMEWGDGNQMALDQLMPLVYHELHRLASNRLRKERSDHTLQATALVHEAFLRLVDWQNTTWQNRAHFFAVAAQLMRNILVDHARNHQAAKRGGGQPRLALDDAINVSDKADVDLIALDDALISLATIDTQQSRIVELRYFGGLTIEETAEVLHISASTVKREWNIAKAWLLRELSHRS
ncbi:MAG: sigma-70 family RNA polymerase sigma factor [Acidobacteriota bacterium]